MLSGVGGRTIDELLDTMTVEEFMVWQRYIKKNGPLDSRLRIDRAIAVLGSRLAGGKAVDYMPWPAKDTIDEMEEGMRQASTEELIAYVGGNQVSDQATEGKLSRGRKWRRKV